MSVDGRLPRGGRHLESAVQDGPISTRAPRRSGIHHALRAEQLEREADRVASITFDRDGASAVRFVGDVIRAVTDMGALGSALLVECDASNRDDWRDVECLAFTLAFRARFELHLLGRLRFVDDFERAFASASSLHRVRADLASIARELRRIQPTG